MSNKKVTYVKETIDGQTGEVVSVQRDVILPNEPDFVKLYISGIMLYADCPQWQNKVLHALLTRIQYNTNEINLPAGQKKRIVDELNISMSALNNAIATFVKRKLLIRTGIGVFLANPHLFGFGKWENISRLRLTVDFSPEGVEMKGDVERKEQKNKKSTVNNQETESNKQLEVFNEYSKKSKRMAVANSAIIPGFTIEQIESLRKMLDANFAPLSIAGMLSIAAFSFYQLIQNHL